MTQRIQRMDCNNIFNEKSDGNRCTSAPAVIMTTYDFWKYLQNGRHTSYGQHSKAAAFFSLIERQHYISATSPEEPLVTSYNKLAKQWGWHRNTVHNFLADLQRLGIIELLARPQGLYINFIAYRQEKKTVNDGSLEQLGAKPPG